VAGRPAPPDADTAHGAARQAGGDDLGVLETRDCHASRHRSGQDRRRLHRADRKGPRRIEAGTEPLLLFVGSLFNRRHLPDVIEGFGRLARRHADTRLEIVGDDRTTPPVDFDRLVRQADAGDRIRIRSYVSEEELASLYARARGFVFLSDYEGFGLTPLEALASGVPIVVLDTPVSREIYGDAAVYVPQPDPALIEAALDRVCSTRPSVRGS